MAPNKYLKKPQGLFIIRIYTVRVYLKKFMFKRKVICAFVL